MVVKEDPVVVSTEPSSQSQKIVSICDIGALIADASTLRVSSKSHLEKKSPQNSMNCNSKSIINCDSTTIRVLISHSYTYKVPSLYPRVELKTRGLPIPLMDAEEPKFSAFG